jgi:carboxyl-terminal processing protease
MLLYRRSSVKIDRTMETVRKKAILTVALVLAVVALTGSGFYAGYHFGQYAPKVIVVQGVSNTSAGQPGSVDFGTFWQAWSVINDNYLRNTDVATQDKVYGAIRGLVNSLQDPYTEFFTPTEGKKFQDDVQGDFGGIGAEIGMKKGQLVVIAPLKDTPAMQAGIKAGDAILKINASSTESLSIDEAVSMIRGPKGSEVTLSIYRPDFDAPKDFKILRDTIVAPTVDLSFKDGDIAYIHIYSFNANLDRLFYDAMRQALQKNVRGIVLDLRDDPGGYLDVAVDTAGWFLPRGALIVSEAGRDGQSQGYRASGNAALADVPIVILINQGSASASEILAGALRDDRHVKLIGEQSFGKGTVQNIETLRDGSTIKVTIAHWVLPGGQILENGGLKPDVEVKAGDDPKKDPQLDKALEVLKGEIK